MPNESDGPDYGSQRVELLSPREQERHEVPAEVLAARGERAFERLYSDLHVRIYNLAARILDDVDEAADVTQDVFLKAFREMPVLASTAGAERWMYRVTVNACYDLLRRRRARATSSFGDFEATPARNDGFEQAQLTRQVEAALAGLSPRYRTALVLKDLHGLGNHEIADIMGISHGTAGVVLFRARAAFRRAFVKASPAGAGTAGLGLAVLLPTLPVPAALQAPPIVAVAAVGTGAASAVVPLAGAAQLSAAIPSAGAHAAGGILAKVGAALATRIALVVVGTSAVVGVGIAVDIAERQIERQIDATASASVAAPTGGSSGRLAPAASEGRGGGLTPHRRLAAEESGAADRQGRQTSGGVPTQGKKVGPLSSNAPGPAGQQGTSGAALRVGAADSAGNAGAGSAGAGSAGAGPDMRGLGTEASGASGPVSSDSGRGDDGRGALAGSTRNGIAVNDNPAD